jgi:hypothetical protein
MSTHLRVAEIGIVRVADTRVGELAAVARSRALMRFPKRPTKPRTKAQKYRRLIGATFPGGKARQSFKERIGRSGNRL